MKSIPVLITAFILVFSFSSNAMATLPTGTVLTIDPAVNPTYVPPTGGSFFHMEVSPGWDGFTSIHNLNGIILGDLQPASGSHSGPPNGSESPDIDNPWSFFGNTGMHQTTLPVVDNGDGTLDFRGWSMTWNGIPDIPLGGDPVNFPIDTGSAQITISGNNYSLNYNGRVPLNHPSGFGGIRYWLRLEGSIILPEPVDSDGDGYTSIDTGGDDCDDTDPSVNPGADEILGNGVDDNCDGAIDNAEPVLFPAGTLLTIEPGNSPQLTMPCNIGSCFHMPGGPGFHLYTNVGSGPDGGIILGQIQSASGSHSGPPNGTESPSIDMPWSFFGNTGMHGTNAPVVDLGGGILDMSGWYVTWNGIPEIPMGGDPTNFPGDTGLPDFTLSGTNYTLHYAAHVPWGSPSGFGGSDYWIHLEGEVIPPSVDVDGDGIENQLDNCPFHSNPGQEDMDGDGLGDVCDDGDGDGYYSDVDCDDSEPTVNPGASEICDDTLDNDCDGFTDINDWADCGDSPCISQTTIRGGGQRPTTTDLQIQTQFTVINGGCIIEESASTLTVVNGTVLVYNFKVGNGPDSDYGELNGDPINTDLVGAITCDETITGLSTNTLYLTNRGNGGKDTDRMSIRIMK